MIQANLLDKTYTSSVLFCASIIKHPTAQELFLAQPLFYALKPFLAVQGARNPRRLTRPASFAVLSRPARHSTVAVQVR